MQPETSEQLVRRVSASFNKQTAMSLIKATMPLIERGCTEIHLPRWEGIQQQHGFIHGGVVGMIADSAGGYAAMTMTSENASVLTVEYKLNMLAPADGDTLIARGGVIKSGRTLIITKAEVFSVRGEKRTLCALMQQTIMVMHDRGEKQEIGNSQS
jgi:uncharacterized protein (TIGR00369 family)